MLEGDDLKNCWESLLLNLICIVSAGLILSCGGGGSGSGGGGSDNRKPVANAGSDTTVPSGVMNELNGSGSSDPDGNTLTYKWTLVSVPALSSSSLINGTSINPLFFADVDGEYIMSLVVNDGIIDSNEDTVQITAVNFGTVSNAGPDKVVATSSEVALDGTASFDANDDPLMFSWSLLSTPEGSVASLSDETAVAPTFTVDVDGVYEVQLIVNDGISDSEPDSVSITAVTKVIIPDTGQTASYITEFGEDSDYSINPPSYTDHGNGTVTDNITGLMWQKCAVGQSNDATCSGVASSIRWYEASGTYDALYNPDSTDVCGSLALGGYDDWRLPSKKELMRIADYGVYSPAIDITYFPNTPSSWSSTSGALDSNHAWYVNFSHGRVRFDSKDSHSSVRCIRGKTSTQNFTDDGNNGTVSDNVTGLMWMKEDDNHGKTWLGAVRYCERIEWRGYDDWRLPNIKELESITYDDDLIHGADWTYFPFTNMAYYWSSTVYADQTYSNNAWFVDFGLGYTGSAALDVLGLARCVRGGI